MNTNAILDRRGFLRVGAAGIATLVVDQFSPSALGEARRDPFLGLKLGVASYSFRQFSLDQAIAMTVDLGLKYICLKSVHLELNSTPAQLLAARHKIQAAGLVLMGGGVITIAPDEIEMRAIFEYAKGAGMPTIVCSPVPTALDMLEKLAVRYDIRVAIHNHGPDDKYYPLPLDALRMVEKRDPHLGICIDVGHTVRQGGDPVAAIRRCAERLYDFHLKDVSAAIPTGRNVVFGTGIIDFRAVLNALRNANFSGHLGMEYEATPDDPLPGMKESVVYLRKMFAALP